MMRKALYSKKNKVNLTAIKVTSINEKEKAKLHPTAQRKKVWYVLRETEETEDCKISCEIKGCLR